MNVELIDQERINWRYHTEYLKTDLKAHLPPKPVRILKPLCVLDSDAPVQGVISNDPNYR
jgi:hypothetical protein